MPGKSGLNRFDAIIFGLLVDLDDSVQPGATAGIDIHIQTLDDLAHLPENGRFPGHAHQQFMLQGAGQQRLPDGIAAVGDRLDFEDRLLANDIQRFGEVNEGAFCVETIPIDSPLEDDFGFGGDEQVHGFGLHHRKRLQGVGDGQFINADLHRGGRGSQDVGRIADANGDIELAGIAQKSVEMSPLDHADGHLRGRELHRPVEGDVLPVAGMLDHEHARGDVRPAVGLEVLQDGQIVEVGLQDNDILTGRGINLRGSPRLVNRFYQGGDDL